MKLTIKLFTLLAMSTAMSSAIALGNSIKIYLVSDSVGPSGRTYVYDAELSAGSNIKASLSDGDLFAIWDFGNVESWSFVANGAIGDGYSASSWIFSQPSTSPVPNVDSTPDTGALNVQMMYKGPPTVVANSGPNSLLLGTLTVTSKLTDKTTGLYVGRDHNNADNTLQGNLGATEVPLQGGPSVPLPASFGGGLALLTLWGLSRYAKRDRE